MKRIRSHVAGNLVGYIALFVALSATSYAAVTLPRNSVTSKQIASNAVGSAELKDNAVTSKKVSGLLLSDFKEGQVATLGAKGGAAVPGPQGAEGPPGGLGPTGPRGPAGPEGSPGFSRLTYSIKQARNPGTYPDLDPQTGEPFPEIATVSARCPAGEYLTGGGIALTDLNQATADSRLSGFDANNIPHAFFGASYNFDDPGTQEKDVYTTVATAICAPADPAAVSAIASP